IKLQKITFNTINKMAERSKTKNKRPDMRNDDEKYCSCVIRVGSKNPDVDAQAICGETVYTRKGLEPPGPKLCCAATKNYLSSLKDEDLISYSTQKGIYENGMSREDIIDKLFKWKQNESKKLSKETGCKI